MRTRDADRPECLSDNQPGDDHSGRGRTPHLHDEP